MADYEAGPKLIAKLKTGKGLAVQGIKVSGQPISFIVPLAGFPETYNGPPSTNQAPQAEPQAANQFDGREQVIYSP